MGLRDRLTRLDNSVLGQPMSEAEAMARLRAWPIRPSWAMALAAGGFLLVSVLAALGLWGGGWFVSIVCWIGAVICAVAAFRSRRLDL